jgi:hypothetical protein
MFVHSVDSVGCVYTPSSFPFCIYVPATCDSLFGRFLLSQHDIRLRDGLRLQVNEHINIT